MTIAPAVKEIQAAIRAKKESEAAKAKVSIPAAPARLDLNSEAVKKFVEQAPDGRRQKRAGAGKWKMRGRKVIITIGVRPYELERLDQIAEERDLTRAELFQEMIQKTLISQG